MGRWTDRRKWAVRIAGAGTLAGAVGLRSRVPVDIDLPAFLHWWLAGPSDAVERCVAWLLLLMGLAWAAMVHIRVRHLAYLEQCDQKGRPLYSRRGVTLAHLTVQSSRFAAAWVACGLVVLLFPSPPLEFGVALLLWVRLGIIESGIAQARTSVEPPVPTASSVVREFVDGVFGGAGPLLPSRVVEWVVKTLRTKETGVSAFVALAGLALLGLMAVTAPAAGRALPDLAPSGARRPDAEHGDRPESAGRSDRPDDGPVQRDGDPAPAAGQDALTAAAPDSYLAQCGGLYAPPGVPRAVSRGLYEAWAEADGAPGANQAGCIGAIEALDGDDGWVATAYCRGRLRSVGTYGPDGSTAIVVGEPARFARERIGSGLVRVDDRRDAGEGDLVPVTTTEGTWLFTRSSKGHGSSGQPRDCRGAAGEGDPYVALPPGATDRLIAYADRVGWSWPQEQAATYGRSFLLPDPEDPDAAAGHIDCSDDRHCVAALPTGEPMGTATGALRIDADEIAARAPARVGP